MQTRERAYHDSTEHGRRLVTIIEGKIARRGTVKIRNQFGFLEDVPAKELQKIDPQEAEAVLRFPGDSED